MVKNNILEISKIVEMKKEEINGRDTDINLYFALINRCILIHVLYLVGEYF